MAALRTPHSLQMLEHGDICVHVTLDAVHGARLLVPVQSAGRDLGGYALLPAEVGEVVDHCTK